MHVKMHVKKLSRFHCDSWLPGKITLVKRLSKGKDMYNEFFKRWATFEKGIDIKTLIRK